MNQLKGTSGWGKSILSRHAHIGTSLGVLIGCGAFLFYAYRLVYLFPLSPDVFFYFSLVVPHVERLLLLIYFVLLKAMIIIAWNGSGQLGSIFEGDVFKKVLSIFITAAILKLAQGEGLFLAKTG